MTHLGTTTCTNTKPKQIFKSLVLICFCLAIFALTSACGGIESADPIITLPPSEPMALLRYKGNTDLLTALKAKATRNLVYLNMYSSCPVYTLDGASDSGPVASTDVESDFASDDDTSGDSVNYSKTNTQETGVDESDIIKSNGDYIFVATDTGIDIFQSWPLEEFHKVTTFEIEDGVSHLFLSEDSLVALSNIYSNELAERTLKINVLDISNPAEPSVLKTKVIEGWFNSARLIDGKMHVGVSSSFRFGYPHQYDFWQDFMDEYYSTCDDYNDEKTEVLEPIIDRYTKIAQSEIDSTTLEDWLPKSGDQSKLTTTDSTNFMTDSSKNGLSLIGIYSLDLENLESEKLTFLEGALQQMYASTESIFFVASNRWQNWWDHQKYRDDSHIHRFALSSSNSLHDYTTSGVVPGHTLNQFSLSENEGYLRIATNEDEISEDNEIQIWASNGTNRVYVLDARKENLPIVGKTKGFGIDEEIYSVRFQKDRGYVVTFRVIDPFFVIDLSDPKNPTVEGELELPGFSTYLHVIDENSVLGVGLDLGTKLSLFDVSNPKAPSLSDEIQWEYSGISEAVYDHHAVTHDAETNLFIIPNQSYSLDTYAYENLVELLSIENNEISTQQSLVLPETSTPAKRTVLIDNDKLGGLYVLDEGNLYLYQNFDEYELVHTEEVSNEIIWNGWCGTEF